ncbi:T9SS-dependent choice-of-anchor J family protein [Pedobacter nanyangensis]|uniref:T9SS-dependent choice-of-anchor J family protein n=1 Tax=Pedobacter nanyangensis TaxID=1562389 RepID=UPI000DE1CD9F|nr:choice-of-anchor J domain-containing protein [Pedobacter nanyangensis]
MKKILRKIIVLVMLVFPVFAFAQKTYLLQETFAGITSGDNTTSTGANSTWSGNTNFPIVDRAYQAGGMVKLGTSSATGSITSKTLNLSANGGNFKVDFKVKGWTAVEGSIKVTVTGIAAPQTVSYTAVMGSSNTETKALSFTGGTNNATIKIETTAKRAYIDEIEVYYETPSNAPSITGGPLLFGNQNINVVSAERTLSLNYTNLDGSDVILTTTAPYAISTSSGGTFVNTVTLAGASLTGSSKNVFVKFHPTATGANNGTINITGGGLAGAASVALSGTGVDPNTTSFDFETCTPSGSTTLPAGFTHQSITGTQTWACTSFGRDASDPTGKASSGNAVQINGGSASSSTENEDWLISPVFDLSAMAYPMLSFWSRTAFAGNTLQLKISTNYTGTGNPNAATWTNIDGKFPVAQSDTWTKSDNIDLSNYKTSTVYIAFVYTSPNATPSNGSRWTLDDFSIRNSSTPAPVELSLPVSSLNFGYQAAGSTSAVRSFTFSASGLTNDVTITAPANFSIAKTSGGAFNTSATYTLAEANNASSTVFVKFAPSTANTNYAQQLSIATAGTTTQTLNLSGNTFDTNNTLEVVNWNIEWFGASGNGPSNKTQQAANVKTIFGNLNADIYGLSEVVDTALFRNSSLPVGYNVIFSDFGSYADDKNHSGYAQAQKLAFMYRTDIIKPVRWFGVLRDTYYPSNLSNNGTGSPYKNWSSGRFPFAMEAKVLVNGQEETVYFIEIHAKANTGDAAAQNDSYDRRKSGALQLKQYIDANLAGKKVIILGDFNDVLNPDKTIAPKPAGTGTSYSDFTSDQTNYFPVTLPLSLAGKRSTAGYATVIDNVIINKSLNNNYLSNSAEVLDQVTALVNSYSSTTTDHYPIQTRYFFNGTLSVNWGYFVPSINGHVVTLKWETKSETDNSHFVVERSLDGKIFAEVAEQQSKGAQGGIYQDIDQNPVQGLNYYRIKQVDRDGQYSWSEVKSVRFLGGNQTAFLVYPNPVKNNISLNYSSNSNQLQLLVSGIDGQAKLRTTGHILDLNNQLNQKVKNLAKGVYIVQITDGGTTYQSKFVKE